MKSDKTGEEEVTEKKNRAAVIITILLCISIFVNILGWAQYREKKERLEALRIDYYDAAKQIKTITDALTKYAGVEKKLKASLKEIKQNKELNRKCIAQYIKARYSATPALIAEAIAGDVVDMAEKHNMAAELLVGIMEVESTFNPYLKSSKDARGLMQVRYEVWAEKLKIEKVSDLHDIKKGIEYGVLVLKDYLTQTKGDTQKALWMYNGRDKDKSKYYKLVFASVGRYTVYKCSKTLNETGGVKNEIIKDEIES